MKSQLALQAEKPELVLKRKESDNDCVTKDLKKARHKNREMTTELVNMKLQYNQLENQYQNAKKELTYFTQKVEEKQREMDKSKSTVVEEMQKNQLEDRILHLNLKIKDQEDKEMNYKKIMIEHQIVKNKLDKCESEQNSKEEQLEYVKSMLTYSERRIVNIEEFVNSQKQGICSLEEKLQESEQV